MSLDAVCPTIVATCQFLMGCSLLKYYNPSRHYNYTQKREAEEEEEHWLMGQHISADKVVALLKAQVAQLKSTINSILMSQVLDTGLWGLLKTLNLSLLKH